MKKIYYYIFFLIILVLPSCKPTMLAEAGIIAHACGEINGYKYTNSIEAAQHAILCGVSFIEIDLALTKDSILVCLHDWSMFHEMTGFTDTKSINYDEFKQRKIQQRYTPMSVHDMIVLLLENPHINVVTDRISDYKIIDQNFHAIRNRVFVECFSYKDYYELEKLGYNSMFSESGPPSLIATTKRVVKYMIQEKTFVTHLPKRYVFSIESETNSSGFSFADCFAVYSVADRKTAFEYMQNNPRVRLMYVDNVE